MKQFAEHGEKGPLRPNPILLGPALKIRAQISPKEMTKKLPEGYTMETYTEDRVKEESTEEMAAMFAKRAHDLAHDIKRFHQRRKDDISRVDLFALHGVEAAVANAGYALDSLTNSLGSTCKAEPERR